MKYSRVILFTCVWGFFCTPFVSAGSISEMHQYAWSDNVGYISFANVIVNSDRLSGFAWSKNSGWINFHPAQGGVLNDGSGHLSGYAWGEHLGWIDFDGVAIDTSTGKFSATATGDIVGTITFDCLQCDVRTDWRSASSGGGSGGGGGGGGGGGFIAQIPSIPSSVKPDNNSPLGLANGFTTFLKNKFPQKKFARPVTRLETVLLILQFRGIPIFNTYSCLGFYDDTVGTLIPWYTCQAVEKARMAQLISAINTQFNPLRPVSRAEAYSMMMKSVCIQLITTEKNWEQEVIKKAIELGFTVRTLSTFEPERSLSLSEMQILSQYITDYDQKHHMCTQQTT